MAVSEEILSSKLNIFEGESTLLSIEDSFWEVVNTQSALDGTNTQIAFTIPPDALAYTDLNMSYLLLECRFVKAADKSDIPDAEFKIGPVNNIASSIFKDISIAINDQRVTSFDENYPYIAFFNAFCHLDSAKKTYLELGLYIEDTYGGPTVLNASNPFPDDGADCANKGLKKRAEYFKGSKVVTLMTKLQTPLHNITKLLLNQLKIEYVFALHDPGFYCMTELDNPRQLKFIIDNAKMYVRRVLPNQSLILAHEKILNDRNATYHTKFFNCKTYNIPTGSYNFIWENIMMNANSNPSVIYVMMVDSKAKSGDYKKNPFVFQLFNIAELECFLGHKQIPNLGVVMRDENDIVQALWQTYHALNYLGSNFGPEALTRETFSKGAAIFSFDLTRDGYPSASYHNTSLNPHLRLQGKFRTATTQAITIIALGLTLGTVEINKFRQPFINY